VKQGRYDISGNPEAHKYLKSGTFSSKHFLDDVRVAQAALPYIPGFYQYVQPTRYRGKISIKIKISLIGSENSSRTVYK